MSRLIVKNLPNGVSAGPGPGNLKLGPVGNSGLGGRWLERIEGFSDLELKRIRILGFYPFDSCEGGDSNCSRFHSRPVGT